MVHGQEGAIVLLPAATVATDASHSMVFDTKGYEYATIDIIVGTHATDGGDITVCKLVEHSSVTAHASMTDVTAFVGGTETSTSVGFVIPSDAALGAGGVIEFNVDLKKRERMLGVVLTTGTTTMQISAIGKLTRSKESADTAAEKSGPTIHSLTSATACGVVVNG